MSFLCRNYISSLCRQFKKKQISNTSKRCISLKKMDESYIPRRSVLYVPGNDERKVSKIPSIGADCVVLDCEDGVALSKKEEARTNIYNVLHNKTINFGTTDCSVRFNSMQSGLCETDMMEILSSANLPQTVHLPKVESVDQLEWFSDKIQKALGGHQIDRRLRLIIFAESAQALLQLPAICQHIMNLQSNSVYKLDGIVFGSDDYCADIGATRTNEASELLYARQYVVTVAKAFMLQAVDVVYIDYKDIDGLRIQSVEGAQFGFTGKQVIHPSQVPVVQEAFSPSSEKITWAKGLIAAFEKHQLEGKGAFTFQGNMIDMPLVLQAKNILQMSSYVKNKR